MTTAIIQIGNSDNKLTQQEWSEFVVALGQAMEELCEDTHFFGFSSPAAPWQNCCVVVDISWFSSTELDRLHRCLARLCTAFRQDSIALTIGNTRFVTAAEKV